MRQYATRQLSRAALAGDHKALKAMAQAVRDHPDGRVVSVALATLRKSWSQSSLDIIWKAWQEKRHPYLLGLLKDLNQPAASPPSLRVLSALSLNQLNLITQGPTSLIQPLIDACHDQDAEISQRALACLPGLKHPAAVDGFCAAWGATRDPMLESILVKSKYLPRKPLSLRILTALKLSRLDIAQSIEADGIPALLAACQDKDIEIANRARYSLTQLQKNDAIQALCQQVIDGDQSEAKMACLQAGYLPSDPVKRVLFLFLTEQWEAYQALDFDQSLLHTLYITASSDLRQRITHELQLSGRINLLPIIAGVNYTAVPSIKGEEEARVLVSMLSDQGDWQTLWRMVGELPFVWSVKIVRKLKLAAWTPQEIEDQELFDHLAELVDNAWFQPDMPMMLSFPPALLKAKFNVKGRINDIAFDPIHPILAFGTGRRKVALWDYKKAAIQAIHAGFTHSIGRVGYCGSTLLCGEKSSLQVPCAITGWNEQGRFNLGEHGSAITAFEPVGKGSLLTAGRDQHIKLWDINLRRIISETTGDNWPRAVVVSPENQVALILQQKPSLVSLPDLKPITGSDAQIQASLNLSLTGMPRCAAFEQDEGRVFIGGHSGQLITSPYQPNSPHGSRAIVTGHAGTVLSIKHQAQRGLVISASSGGEVIFTNWPDRTEKNRLSFPGFHLTSMQISSDGYFMAVGSSDEVLWLWDLRTLDIPKLMTLPFSSFTSDHLALLSTLLEAPRSAELTGVPAQNGTILLEEAKIALEYMRTILRYRFRYDIQVSALPVIQPGEYDIIVD